LGHAYVAAIAPGAVACIATLQSAGVRVVIVSGGVRQALLPLASVVGIAANDVHAVTLQFSADGQYEGFDPASPLTRQTGKSELLRTLSTVLPPPVLHVGDGMTDALAREAVAAFAAFTGFGTTRKRRRACRFRGRVV